MLSSLTASAAHGLPARDIAGVALHPWRMENPDVRERTFADIAASGARWARVDLSWNFVEPHGPALAADRGNWSAMDAIVRTADRHGVTLLPILGHTPPWASAERDPWAHPDVRRFADFFAAALRRYPQIPAWELWNEPNLSLFAKPQPDPVRFVELLRTARNTRDRLGSTAKLVSGGLSSGGEIDIFDWVDQMALQGGLELVDGLGVHPYSVEEPDDPDGWLLRLEALHAQLAELGRADLPLWLTEYGGPSISTANGYAPALTEEQQAHRLRLAFAVATRWPWVANLTWYEYRDSCVDPVNPECNFGLVRADLSPKPAYGALREVVAGVTTKLRPRLVLRSRVERAGTRMRRRMRGWGGPSHRVALWGALFLPGSSSPMTRITARLEGRGIRPRTFSIAVRHGFFFRSLSLRGASPRGVVARYAGSSEFESVLVRAPVHGRRRVASAR
jgi:polysaccharide biosynthesis protein PslG